MKKLKKILIVDDDDISNMIAVELLEELKLAESYTIFKNGMEAYHYLLEMNSDDSQDKIPELIFLDHHMPVMDGTELIEALKKEELFQSSHAKMVIISASVNEKDRDYFRSLGFDEFINKPLTEDKILGLMSKYFPTKSSGTAS